MSPTDVADRTESSGTKLFLSHSGADSVAAKELKDRLETAGLDVWLDLDEIAPGDSWMQKIEEGLDESDAFAVFIGRSGINNWVTREVRDALDRSTRDPSYRFIPILAPESDPEQLPKFVRQHQWLDLRQDERDPDKLRKLVATLMDRAPESVRLMPSDEAPYLGLASFTHDDAHLFFGRDRETNELLERLRDSAFVAVVGASGSGKSSLVRAGLVPAIHSGRFDDGSRGSAAWQVLTMQPGRDPFRGLQTAMLDQQGSLSAEDRLRLRGLYARELEAGGSGLQECLATSTAVGTRTLLVVDQFEELFTHVGDEAARNLFIDTLLDAASTSGDRPIYVVITLRADFYSNCFSHPRLPSALQTSQYVVHRIGPEQMREVIEKPASFAGLELEKGLAEAILSDLGTDSGALALLQHTLLELWKARTGATLTHRAYEDLGRVQGALEHHAESVFRRLSPEDQRLGQILLLRLVNPRESGATRLRLDVEEILPDGDGRVATRRVLDFLVEQRLLTPREEDDRELVEVTHEALLRGWGRLRGWLEEDREFLFWRQRTRPAFQAWEESGGDSGALLRGARLVEAARWLEERRDDLVDRRRLFIEASLQRAERQRLVRRAAIGTIAALGLISVVLAFRASSERRTAEQNLLLAQEALLGIGEVTQVAGAELAESPEVASLKRELTEKALGFFTTFEDRSEFADSLQLEKAVARYRLAKVHSLEGDHERAESEYRGAIDELEALSQEHADSRGKQELATAIDEYAVFLRERGTEHSAVAASQYDRADALRLELIISAESPEEKVAHEVALARTRTNRGILRMDSGKFSLAEADFTEVMRSMEAVLERTSATNAFNVDAHQVLAWATNAFGYLLTKQQRFDVAARHYESASELHEKLVEHQPGHREHSFELGRVRNNLANLYYRLGRPEQAIAQSVKARDVFEGLARAAPVIENELANGHLTLASIQRVLGRRQGALQSFQVAADTFERLVGEHPANEQYFDRYLTSLVGIGLVAPEDVARQVSDRLDAVEPEVPRSLVGRYDQLRQRLRERFG